MNSIALQIDYTTDVLRATNDLLEARAAHRQAQSTGNIHAVIDAQVKVIKAELALKELYPADDETTAPNVDPLPDCGERFPPRQRVVTLHPDDPRRGQAESINQANRGQ